MRCAHVQEGYPTLTPGYSDLLVIYPSQLLQQKHAPSFRKTVDDVIFTVKVITLKVAIAKQTRRKLSNPPPRTAVPVLWNPAKAKKKQKNNQNNILLNCSAATNNTSAANPVLNCVSEPFIFTGGPTNFVVAYYFPQDQSLCCRTRLRLESFMAETGAAH